MKHAFRSLVKSPGFTAVALLTLALGIGVNTSMFSVLRTVFLRTLPYADADRLVRVHRTGPNFDARPHAVANFLDLREQNTVVDHLTAIEWAGFGLTADDRPAEWLRGMRTTADFFPLLGRPPALGRVFTAEDDQPGRSNVIVLSHPYWAGRFGADPAIVGRNIVLDEVPRTVIGVLPKGAWMLKEDSFFVPAVLAPNTERSRRAPHWAGVFGRLASHTTVARADAELKTIKRQLNAEYPPFKQRWSVVVQPVTEVIGGVARTPLMILLGAVSLVLLLSLIHI